MKVLTKVVIIVGLKVLVVSSFGRVSLNAIGLYITQHGLQLLPPSVDDHESQSYA